MANMMRKMHVPAYLPVEFGVQAFEKRGVSCALINVMAIDIDIEESWPEWESDEWPPPISIPPIPPEEFDMSMPSIFG